MQNQDGFNFPWGKAKRGSPLSNWKADYNGRMRKGKLIREWADRSVLTEHQGRFYLWEPTDTGDRNIKPEGFDTKEKATDYAARRNRLLWETEKAGLPKLTS